MKPGGMRTLTMALELATMLSGGNSPPLNTMRDAWVQLTVRQIGA